MIFHLKIGFIVLIGIKMKTMIIIVKIVKHMNMIHMKLILLMTII